MTQKPRPDISGKAVSTDSWKVDLGESEMFQFFILP